MTIWIDGDGFPARQRDIAVNAALREDIPIIVVADRPLRVVKHPLVRTIQVTSGDDSADDTIAGGAAAGDLVITRDILLMERCVAQGARCVDHAGNLVTRENIKERVSIRSAMEAYREFGGTVAPKKQEQQKERQAFANMLVQVLTGRI